MPDITMIKACFISLMCEAFLHGIYTILCSAAFYLLFRKSRSRRISLPNILMISVTAIMFLSATVHLVLSFYVNYVAVFYQDGAQGDGLNTALNDFRDPKLYSQIALEVVNCIIGDTVVLWRTWVIWGKSPRIIVFPSVCIVGALVSAIGLLRAFSLIPPEESLYTSAVISWFEPFGAFTCAINIYAVAAISYKTWENFRLHRSIGTKIAMGGGSAYGILLILIESGIVYCVVLVVTLILFSVDSGGVYIMTDILGQITGIYPTVIIVLVCLKMSWENSVLSTSLPNSTVRYAHPVTSTISTDPSELYSNPGLRSRILGNVAEIEMEPRPPSGIKIQAVTVKEVWDDKKREEVVDIRRSIRFNDDSHEKHEAL